MVAEADGSDEAASHGVPAATESGRRNGWPLRAPESALPVTPGLAQGESDWDF